MKLLRARIENFRLLKEVELDFSTDADRNLSIIRAANESGKTTLLTALQWGLFGDKALPKEGKKFRHSPLDASSGERKSVTVSVEVDYEIPNRESTYRLIRSVTEIVRGGDWQKESTKTALFELKRNGADQMPNAEAHIRSHLPDELREVFFTDGDRALSFIEGDSRRKNVEEAIRALLGLDVMEDALKHVRDVCRGLNRQVQTEVGNQDKLKAVSRLLAALQEEIPELEKNVNSVRESRLQLEDLEQEADNELSDALRKGNREELEKQRQAAIRGRESAERDAAKAARDHADLFKSEFLGKHLLAEPFKKAKDILDGLHREGKIPSQTIPVLEDRLNQPTCICGERLDPNDQDGQKRRKHIRHLIDESRNSDEIQKKVTELFYSAQDLLGPVEGSPWADRYNGVFERRQSANRRSKDHGEAVRAAEAKIRDLPDVDIQQLRESRDRYRVQHRDYQSREIRLVQQLATKRQAVKEEETKRERLLQQDEKGRKFAAELDVAKDLEDILNNALETMKTRELKRVSEHMNTLFLEMIGSDASQRAIITRAEITEDFRIVVFGRYDQPLDLSHDLNGASRRALTIAFILALAKVSEVEAPNVIDTPLGMTSGYVKTSILQRAAQHSSQLILFLTHDEIKGCEEILDRYAGRVYTLTNPAHYPRILVNDPGVDDTRVLLCACNHQQHCEICERREKASLEDGDPDTPDMTMEA